MEEHKKELTPTERRVYNKLIGGAIIITDSHVFGALISGHGADMRISTPAFSRLRRKGMLYQNTDTWDFELNPRFEPLNNKT